MKHFNLLVILCLVGFHQVSADQPEDVTIRIAKYKADKICALSYTFDDGLKEHYTLAAPEMEKHGFKGTFWINGFKINQHDAQPADTTRMSWENLKAMNSKGHEISSHSWSHKKLVTLSLKEATAEIEKNDSIIFEKIGVAAKTFCYPYNAKNNTIVELASRNRVGTRTQQFSLGSKMTPVKLDQKINELMERGDWGVAMTHGITYGYDAFGNNSSVLWEHFRKVKALDNKIWVGTFCEIASYIREREETHLQVTQEKGKLTVIPTLSLDKQLFTESLTGIIEKGDLHKVTARQGNKKLKTRIFADKALFDFDPFGGAIRISYK